MSTRIEELQRALETEREAQAAAAAAAAREQRDREQQRKRAAAALAGEVAAAEKNLPRILDAARAAAEAQPPHSLPDRWQARRLLLGTLTAPPDVTEIGMIARTDDAFALLAGAHDAAEQLVIRAEREIGVDDPLCVRAAAVECALHRAVQGRARAIADGLDQA
jgi:hypothetical protein